MAIGSLSDAETNALLCSRLDYSNALIEKCFASPIID